MADNQDLETLRSIRDVVKGLSLCQLNEKHQLPDLLRIFDYLDTSDPEQINVGCEVLDACFSGLSISYVVENTTDNIIKSLHHTSATVRLMAIKQIDRIIFNSNFYTLPEHMNVAVEIVKCIGDQDLAVAVQAMKIVCHGSWLQSEPITDELKNIIESSDTSSRCRAYEVVVEVVKKSPDFIKDDNVVQLLYKLIAELKTDDILLQLNILELLSNLSVAPHGLNFLIENNVLKSLAESIEKLEGNPIANLVIPGFMKFFGAIAYLYPTEIYQNYPFIVEALFDAIRTNNSILPTALDTLGFVGATVEGKLSLAALGRVFTDALPYIGTYIKNSPTEMRVKAMSCIESLIAVKPNESESIDQRVTLMTREWFRELSERPNSIEVVHGICKNPFPELRTASFKLLYAICQHNWGQELVKSSAGFVEFLLNRSVEHSKESKEIKYDIMKRLCESGVFEDTAITSFNEYVKEGPFYVDGLMEVATEGD